MAALFALAALIGVAAPPHSFAQEDERAEIQALLDARAAAVLSGDRDAFLAGISGSEAFLRRQARLFDGLQSLPLESYELTARWDRAGDLARRSDRAAYDDAEVVSIPLTEERYALHGIDTTPALEDLFLTFVRADGRWSIAADDDLEEVGLFSARHVWEPGPVHLQEGHRAVLIEHPCTGYGSRPHGCAGIPDDFLDLVDASVASAEERLPALRLPTRVAMLAPGTQGELARIIQATYPLDNFLAFATSSVDTSRGIRFTGHRVALNWPQINDASEAYLRTIVTHELVHIGTRQAAGPFTPFFLDEGIAEHVARADDPASLQPLEEAIEQGRFDRRLPENHEFRTGGPEAIFLSYKESQSAVTFLIDRWGDDSFIDLYEELGRRRLVAGTIDHHLDEAFRSALGIGFTRFERMWADSID